MTNGQPYVNRRGGCLVAPLGRSLEKKLYPHNYVLFMLNVLRQRYELLLLLTSFTLPAMPQKGELN